MSGHSKWSTIKHKKGALDARRGRIWTKCIKEIQVAARLGGGDVNANPRLRKAVAAAKAESMPADNITKAIKRGTGELEGQTYEEASYEATGPGGALFIIEALTDNKNRTVAELRKLFEKHNGVVGQSGTAAWAFDRKGLISLPKDSANEDQLMDVAVGAGADDYAAEGDEWSIVTPPDQLDVVAKSIEAGGLTPTAIKIGFIPKSKRLLSGHDAEVCLRLIKQIDDHDDVQNFYTDADISEDVMAKFDE